MNPAIFGIKPVAQNWTKNVIAVTGGSAIIARDIAYSGSAYLAVGTNAGVSSYIASATNPASTWTIRSISGLTGLPTAAASNGTRFVIVARQNGAGVGDIFYTDDDGASFTITSATDREWNSVCFGGGLFVAAGSGSPSNAASSADGATWTDFTIPVTNCTSVFYGGGLYIAVGEGGTIATSPDAVTWTARTSGTTDELYKVRYKAGVWLAVGYPGSGVARLLVSFDGITWTSQTAPVALTFPDVLGVFGAWFIVSGASSAVMHKSISGLTSGYSLTATAANALGGISTGAPLIVRWFYDSGTNEYGVYTSS